MADVHPDVIVDETAVNLIAQLSADRVKKPALTDLDVYLFMLEHYNALYARGVIPSDYTPDNIFTRVAQLFSNLGYPSIAQIFNEQEGEGDFASWPLTYHPPI